MTILVAQALTWIPPLRHIQALGVTGLVTLAITLPQGGLLPSQTVSGSQTQTTAFVDFGEMTFTSATITARGALIYNDTNSDKVGVYNRFWIR